MDAMQNKKDPAAQRLDQLMAKQTLTRGEEIELVFLLKRKWK